MMPEHITITRRSRPAARHSLMSLSDLGTTALLPPMFACSWMIPESQWRRILEGLAGSRSANVESPIARGVRLAGLGTELAATADEISRDLRVHRYLSYLQYFRDYRSGGWCCNAVLEGAEPLHAARAEGRGIVLWVAHFVYNGLPLKKALHQAGVEVFHLSRPEHGFSDTTYGVKVLNPLRSRIEERYLARRIIIKRGAEHVAMRAAHRLVSEGKVVSITAGHWEGRQVASLPIGASVLPVSIGAPSLAHATGAHLFPVFIRQGDDGIFRVRVGSDLNARNGLTRTAAVSSALAGFSEQLLSSIKLAPSQWRGWKYLSPRP